MLIISKKDFDAICESLESVYPNEGCGALLGDKNGDRWITRKVIPLANNAKTDQDKRYEISPTDMLNLLRTERESGLSILGFYHSHPDYPPMASVIDSKDAWEGYYYPIFSVIEGRVSMWTAWRLEINAEELAPAIALLIP